MLADETNVVNNVYGSH